MKNIKTVIGTAILVSAVSMAGCVVHPEHPQSSQNSRGYGPPPHAPAHGYRHKYYDHDMEYDSNLGVYIVLGLAGVYFLNEIFYRYDRDHHDWYSSRHYDRDWRPYRDGRLPPGLAKKYRDGDRGNDRDDDRGRGNGRDDDRGRGNGRDDDHGRY